MVIKHGLKMKIQYCTNYDQMSNLAFNSILNELKVSSNKFICAATGNSPTGIYKLLSDINIDHPEYFKKTNIIKLDEWGGLSKEDTDSCEFYIRNKIFYYFFGMRPRKKIINFIITIFHICIFNHKIISFNLI